MRVVQRALTFDDVSILPAHSTVVPRDVSLKSRLTRAISAATGAIRPIRNGRETRGSRSSSW